MLHSLLAWYFAIALIVFSFWLSLFLRDYTTPNKHLVSWIVLIIAPLFWPIVLPLSCRELLTKASATRRLKTKVTSQQ